MVARPLPPRSCSFGISASDAFRTIMPVLLPSPSVPPEEAVRSDPEALDQVQRIRQLAHLRRLPPRAADGQRRARRQPAEDGALVGEPESSRHLERDAALGGGAPEAVEVVVVEQLRRAP